ncbi:MAG TPA: L-threonylcarbamoyladenylate synthase [Sedimentisphaerales bacterium]|nr:L-threonylcarbamoyladenylate synthase [Sedimentisphaerales bacterium]
MIIDYYRVDINTLGVEYLAIRLLVVYFMAPMQTKIVKLDATNIDSAKIKDAASLIDDGGLVAFPTETVYGIACRVKTDSLARLNNIKGRDPTKYYTLHIGQKNDVKKYVPTIGLRAEKLIKNAWPGPLTIIFELDRKDIDKQRKNLEREFFKSVYKNNSIGIRCPDNPIATMLLQSTNSPVVAPSANIAGQSPAVDADQALAQLSGQIELLLDAGPCKYKKSSTVVKIGNMGIEILRPGVYSQAQLDAMSVVKFLFVCTGNTCRSPMAEGIFRKYLAEKLKCKVDQLNKVGYKICSAGVMDVAGVPASAEAIAACAAKGIDLTAHRNQGLSKELIEESDLIFAMERMHQDNIIALSHEAANKCFLLAGDTGIADPIGHSQEFFNSCSDIIEAAVKNKISELVI